MVFLFGLQYWNGWSWPWLETRQKMTGFKQLTGLSIFLFLLFQNALFITRTSALWPHYQKKIYRLHSQTSVFSMPLLYLHTAKMGHHYTFLFTLAYSLNVLVGCFAPLSFNIRNKQYGFYWMVLHVSLSTFISFFIFFHIFMTFYYN